MSDTPASGAEPFVRNALALVEARQEAKFAALETAGGVHLTLEPFKVFNNSARRNQQWPALTVAPVTENDPLDDSGTFRGDDIVLVASLEEIAALTEGGNDLGYQLMRRARGVKEIVREATKEEMGAGLDEKWLPLLEWDVGEIRYATLQNRDETQLMKLATMVITIKLLVGEV